MICQDLAGHRGRRQGGPKRGDRQADKIKYKPRRDHGKRQHGRRPWERRRKKEKKKNKTSLSVSEGEEIEILAGQSRASEKQSGSVAGTVIPKGTEKENTAGPWLPCPLQTSLAEPGGEDGALNRRREVGCGRSLGRRQPARPLPPPVPTGGICTQRAPPDPGLHPGCKGHSELHGSPTSPHGAGAHVPTPSRPTSPWGSKPRKNLTSRVCPTRCDPLPEASERLQDAGTFRLSIGPLRPRAGASRAPLPARTCQQHREGPPCHAFPPAKGVVKAVTVTPKKFSKATASHTVSEGSEGSQSDRRQRRASSAQGS